MIFKLIIFVYAFYASILHDAVAINIDTGNLADGIEMVDYSKSISITNSTGPLYWYVIDGSLPPGLQLSQTGEIVGIPEMAGDYTFQIWVYDAGSWLSDTAVYTLRISPNSNQRPVLWGRAPDTDFVSINEQNSRLFRVYAYDPEGVDLTFSWYLNGLEVVAEGDRFNFETTWGDGGYYDIRVDIADDLWGSVVFNTWTVYVDDDNNSNGIPNLVEIDIGRNPNEPLEAGSPASIRGAVTAGGTPLEGAAIELSGVSGRVYHRAFSDAMGSYSVSGIIPGYYHLAARAQAFADEWYDNKHRKSLAATVQFTDAESRVGFDFDLAPGQSPALVEVTSDPSGAEIYLDYQPLNVTTPAIIDVGEIGVVDFFGNSLASHVISLKAPGYPLAAPRVVAPVEAETVSVHVDLFASTSGVLQVESDPSGAEVYVNYADIPEGVTPVTIENLAPGSHTLLLRADGFLQPRPIHARINPGETTVVQVPLVSPVISSNLVAHVRSAEQDLDIFVDYLPSGKVTDAVIDYLDPASHAGFGWYSASHVVLLKKAGVTPFAPRYVPDNLSTGASVIEIPFNALRISTSELPGGTYGVPFSVALRAEGGALPYLWREVPVYQESFHSNSFEYVGHRWRSGMDATFELALPFAFPFYGGEYTNCFVDTHGVIRFEDGASDWAASTEKLAQISMIAALWEDLLAYGTQVELYLDKTAERVTVRWYVNDKLNVSVTLFPDGSIQFKYGAGNEYVGLVGVSGGDGLAYALSARSGAVNLFQAQDIIFTPSSVMPSGFTLSDEGLLTGEPDYIGRRKLTIAVSDRLGNLAVKTLDLVVAPNPLTSSLSGVIRGDGSPLAGAFIELRDENNAMIYRAETSSNGVYTLEAIYAGPYYIKVGAPYFAHEWYDEAAHFDHANTYLVPVNASISGLDFDLKAGSNTSVVRVISSPPGAAIFVDYWPTGEVTPATVMIGESGERDADGYQLASRVITLRKAGIPRPAPVVIDPIQAETIEVAFDFASMASGALHVYSDPANAEVYVNYANAMDGYTPVLVENLAPGTHTLLLRRAGYLQPRPVRAVVESGRTNTIVIPMSRANAEDRMIADVRSTPKNVPVFVDYLPSGLTTDALINYMDPASHAGAGWHSASHVIQLRPEDRLPSAPRYVPEARNVMHTMIIPLSVDPISIVDSNSDGIPDWWCELYELDPRDPYLANKTDASGMTYRDKYLAGLIPNDPNSSLRLSNFEVNSGASTKRLVFELETVAGKKYLIQGQDEVGNDTWTNITDVFTASESTTTIEADIDAGSDLNYYRLILVVP